QGRTPAMSSTRKSASSTNTANRGRGADCEPLPQLPPKRGGMRPPARQPHRPLLCKLRPRRWRVNTLVLDIPSTEWMTSNQRYGHWAQKAKRTKAIRSRTAWLARAQQLTVPTPTIVAVQVHYPRNGNADPSNSAPAVKAALDGITDSGAWPDDNSKHVVE